jgi:ferric iron reductase protein FhuF
MIINQIKSNQTNVVQDEKGDLVADCHGTLARWRNHFSQLFNVNGVSDVRETEIQTAAPLFNFSGRTLLHGDN